MWGEELGFYESVHSCHPRRVLFWLLVVPRGKRVESQEDICAFPLVCREDEMVDDQGHVGRRYAGGRRELFMAEKELGSVWG